MHIVWITASFHPRIGGLEQYSVEVVKRLAQGHRLTLISDASQYLPTPQMQSRIDHIGCSGLGGSRSRNTWQHLRQELQQHLHLLAPDLVHLGDAGMAVFRDLVPSPVPVVVTVHGNDLSSPWQLAGRDPVSPQIVRGVSSCQLVLAVSRHTAGLLSSRGIEVPIRVIHSTCDSERFHPLPDLDRSAFRHRFKLPSGVPLLLTVGRLAPRKGHLHVLRALAGLDADVHWLVVGQGEMSRALKWQRLWRGLRQRISLPGWIPADDLVLAYNLCDLFVLTPTERRLGNRLDSEGFGLVFHEAAACAKPVIASDVSGCREAVLHGRTGLLVPPGDVSALRTTIAELLADPERARKLGEQGRWHIEQQGGWHRVVEEIEDAYGDVVRAGTER